MNRRINLNDKLKRHILYVDIQQLTLLTQRILFDYKVLAELVYSRGVLTIDSLVHQSIYLVPYYAANNKSHMDESIHSLIEIITETLPEYNDDAIFSQLQTEIFQAFDLLTGTAYKIIQKSIMDRTGLLPSLDVVSIVPQNIRLVEVIFE